MPSYKKKDQRGGDHSLHQKKRAQNDTEGRETATVGRSTHLTGKAKSLREKKDNAAGHLQQSGDSEPEQTAREHETKSKDRGSEERRRKRIEGNCQTRRSPSIQHGKKKVCAGGGGRSKWKRSKEEQKNQPHDPGNLPEERIRLTININEKSRCKTSFKAERKNKVQCGGGGQTKGGIKGL